jgi:hypothetical protein
MAALRYRCFETIERLKERDEMVRALHQVGEEIVRLAQKVDGR